MHQESVLESVSHDICFCMHQGSLTKERNRHSTQELPKLQTPRSGDSGALPRALGPMHPSSSCWEHGLLTAHSCSPHCAFSCTGSEPWLWPLLGSNSWPVTDWCKDTKIWSHRINLGQLWGAISASELPGGSAEVSVATTMWVSFSLCPLWLPHFLIDVSPKSALQKTCKPLSTLVSFPRNWSLPQELFPGTEPVQSSCQ